MRKILRIIQISETFKCSQLNRDCFHNCSVKACANSELYWGEERERQSVQINRWREHSNCYASLISHRIESHNIHQADNKNIFHLFLFCSMVMWKSSKGVRRERKIRNCLHHDDDDDDDKNNKWFKFSSIAYHQISSRSPSPRKNNPTRGGSAPTTSTHTLPVVTWLRDKKV